VRSSPGEPEGIGPHNLIAGPNTEAAEQAVVSRGFGFVGSFFAPQFPGKILDERNMRASGEKKPDEDASSLEDPFRMGFHADPFPGRIVAGRDHPGLSVFRYLHGTKPAGALGCQVRMIAKSRDGDRPLPADFQKGRLFPGLNFLPVNRQINHFVMLNLVLNLIQYWFSISGFLFRWDPETSPIFIWPGFRMTSLRFHLNVEL
jgi:hypothetical protein